MNSIKKMLTGVALAVALVNSVQAAPITVGGVTWDPNSAMDFSATSNFFQWFQPGVSADATTAVAIANAGTPVTRYLAGVGLFGTFNDANNIAGEPAPETLPAQFAPGAQLSYEFGGVQVVRIEGATTPSPTYTLDLSNAYFKVWYDTVLDFNNSLDTLAGSAGAELNKAIGGSVFLSGKIDTFNLILTFLASGNPLGSTNTLTGSASALLSVTGGAAAGNFNTDSFINGVSFADLAYSASAQFVIPVNGTVLYTKVATAEFTGQSIPEPGTLLLLGVGLAGLAAASMRRKHV